MAFCVKCGKEMKDGAKFCPSCGAQTPGAASAAAPAPKPAKEKQGNVKVCPNCGAPLESFQIRCSACGHEINTVGVDSSLAEFTKKLAKFAEEGKSSNEFIQSYPVPNTREALLEFAILASSKITAYVSTENNSFGNYREMSPWHAKIHQIYEKAQLACADDPAAMAKIEAMVKKADELYETECEKNRKEHKKGDVSIIIVRAVLLGIVALIIFGIIKACSFLF
ncbi:MAG: zinc-ribbon domain-containing protein [Spirochaetales bacterium]|jgi:RNA polymerase subunit RPABC4/transcription elongation factor Spt4|nr:zinc-ribbon domain-containing protein [Spirochaetales bacterium]